MKENLVERVANVIHSNDCKVWLHKEKAIKFCWRADQYTYAIGWFEQNKESPHVPHIYSHRLLGDNTSLTVMERLIPVLPNDEEMNQFASVAYATADERICLVNKMAWNLYALAKNLGEFALNRMLPLDLNSKNFMRRSTGELVIVDPFY